jgi:hypothetical protein
VTTRKVVKRERFWRRQQEFRAKRGAVRRETGSSFANRFLRQGCRQRNG